MLIEVQSTHGPQMVRVCDLVRVCDYCQTVCIPSGRFCSGRCARSYDEAKRRQPKPTAPPAPATRREE